MRPASYFITIATEPIWKNSSDFKHRNISMLSTAYFSFARCKNFAPAWWDLRVLFSAQPIGNEHKVD
jgi:hypothetical protein